MEEKDELKKGRGENNRPIDRWTEQKTQTKPHSSKSKSHIYTQSADKSADNYVFCLRVFVGAAQKYSQHPSKILFRKN